MASSAMSVLSLAGFTQSLVLLLLALSNTASGLSHSRLSKVEARLAKLEAVSEIKLLANCYSYGVDTILGNPLGVGPGVNQSKSVFRPCFTKNATVVFRVPGTPDGFFYGTDAYVDFLYGFFQKNSFVATNHLIGTQKVLSLSNNKASMITYVLAQHIVEGRAAIDYSTGYYLDDVVLVKGSWKIKKRIVVAQIFYKVSGPVVPL